MLFFALVGRVQLLALLVVPGAEIVSGVEETFPAI
jgi:hypothetical protein